MENAPEIPFDRIGSIVEQELGKPLPDRFAVFDERPCCGSVAGQVHRATLPDGSTVAVKATRLTLSKAHQRILDTEADFANVRRSQFLENLLRIRSGSPSGFLRRDAAPVYEFRENDLIDAGETWAWYFTEDAAALLKEAMARLGVRDPVSWVSWALNQWVGKPDGFVKGKDGKYR